MLSCWTPHLPRCHPKTSPFSIGLVSTQRLRHPKVRRTQQNTQVKTPIFLLAQLHPRRISQTHLSVLISSVDDLHLHRKLLLAGSDILHRRPRHSSGYGSATFAVHDTLSLSPVAASLMAITIVPAIHKHNAISRNDGRINLVPANSTMLPGKNGANGEER